MKMAPHATVGPPWGVAKWIFKVPFVYMEQVFPYSNEGRKT